MYKLQSNSYTISIPKVEGKDKYMKFYPSFYEALASPSISDEDFRLAIQLMYQMFFEGLEIRSEELPLSLYAPFRLIGESLKSNKTRSEINKENGTKGGAKTKQNAEKAKQYDEEHSAGNLDPEETMQTMLESLEALPVEEPKETKPKKKFVKPTIEEIKEYASIHFMQIDAEKFYDFYESNGWKVGRNSMKDWKAAVRNWVRRDSPSDTQTPVVTNIKYEKEECPKCHQQKLIWNNDKQKYKCTCCENIFKLEEVLNV